MTSGADEGHAGTSRPLRVFLCHASPDKTAVRDLYRRLKADGFDVWLDEERLLPGHEWEYEIRKAVRAADAIIVCLSQQAVTRTGFVQDEIPWGAEICSCSSPVLI